MHTGFSTLTVLSLAELFPEEGIYQARVKAQRPGKSDSGELVSDLSTGLQSLKERKSTRCRRGKPGTDRPSGTNKNPSVTEVPSPGFQTACWAGGGAGC